ncbi:MAG: hypothetical protein M3487_00680, partial [Actinomycetota bacterium]|nr:hypothetical protein [Actinomycetota bacterium]
MADKPKKSSRSAVAEEEPVPASNAAPVRTTRNAPKKAISKKTAAKKSAAKQGAARKSSPRQSPPAPIEARDFSATEGRGGELHQAVVGGG